MRHIALGDTLDIKFTSRRFSSGAPFTLAGSPVISAYPDNSTTEITAGITLTVDFDGRTGLNHVRIVASSGNGYAAASRYFLVITTGTVDGVSVVGEVVGEFIIAPIVANVTQWLGSAPNALAGGRVSATADAITNATIGASTFVAGAINAAAIATGAITAAKFAAGAIDAAAIADGAIDAATLATGTITAAKFAANAVDAAALAADAVTEIQAGLATSANQTTILGRLPTALVSGRMDASIGAVAANAITAAGIATDAIGSAQLAASAVTEIQTGLATAAAQATLQADTDDIQTRLPAALVGGRMDASVGAMAANVLTATAIAADAITAAKIANGAIDAATFAAGALDAAALASDAAVEIAAAVWDRLLSLHTTAGSAGKTLADLTSGGGPSAAAIADAVWDELLSGHLGAGSAGAALNGAGSAGDPWTTPLPGAYGAGTAGNILGSRLDAAVSTRATPAQVNTEADQALVDAGVTPTVMGRLDVAVSSRLADAAYTAPDNATIAAINAKTTNLPADPADASDIAAQFTTVNTKLDTVDGRLDTEIPAILAKVNPLPANPASTSDVTSAAAGVPAAVWANATRTLTSGGTIPADVVAALMAEIIEGAITYRQSIRIQNAAMGGRASGLETTSAKYRDLANTKDRITATVDEFGNRLAVAYDLT